MQKQTAETQGGGGPADPSAPPPTTSSPLPLPQPADPIPIEEAARRLGLRASAIRYYEERGLVRPAARRAGRRWYGPAEIRRLAVIRYWQRSGLMSLDEIGDVLGGPDSTHAWPDLMRRRIEALRDQA